MLLLILDIWSVLFYRAFIGSFVWLLRPMPLKFGGRWMSLCLVVSSNGVNFSFRSKTGNNMFVHNNNFTDCIRPFGNGISFSLYESLGIL